MKHNWEYKRLSDVCETFIDGDWIESKDQSNDGFRLIQTGNVGKGIFLDKAERSKYISEDTFYRLKCTEIFEGDLLISRLPDPIGRACILPPLKERSITAVDCAIVRPIDILNKRLLLHFTSSKRYAAEIDAFTKGSTRKRVSRGNLGKIEIPVPPMEVQERIVAELDGINAQIDRCRQLLQTLDSLATSLFYDTFGDPVTNPKGWPVSFLGNIVAPKKEILRASKVFDNNDEIIYFDISSVNRLTHRIENANSYLLSDAPSRAQQVSKFGDVLISLVRPNLQNIAINIYNYNNAVASTGFGILRPNPTLTTSCYIFHLVISDSITDYLCTRMSGASYPAITEDILRGMPVPIPPLALQQQFAAQVEAIEAQKAKVEATIAELQTLLDSRMDYWFN